MEIRATTPSRRLGTALTDVLLWVVAGLGCLCVVLVALAFTANVTLMMFRTGSMSPAIPAGAVAIVQQIPASEIHIGDVVTVDRPGELPITHRVTSVEPGTSSAERMITMRGDANAQDDPAPYSIGSVRIVRFSIPGIAPMIAAMGNPLVLGGVTVGVAALVFWAFWPGRSRAESAPERVGDQS
jgi:signal peptidase